MRGIRRSTQSGIPTVMELINFLTAAVNGHLVDLTSEEAVIIMFGIIGAIFKTIQLDHISTKRDPSLDFRLCINNIAYYGSVMFSLFIRWSTDRLTIRINQSIKQRNRDKKTSATPGTDTLLCVIQFQAVPTNVETLLLLLT